MARLSGAFAAFSAYIAHASGEHGQMRQHGKEMLDSVAQGGKFQSRVLALPATALFLVAQGQNERAVELYALSSRQAYVAHSRWFQDLFGRRVDACAAHPEGVPPVVVAAARERGRARDLETTVVDLLKGLSERV